MTAPAHRPRRLRIGEIVKHDARLWRVDLVNACRARLVPLNGRTARFHSNAGDGRDVEFNAPGRPISICPDSELERIDASTLTEETLMASKKKTPKTTAPKAPKAPKAKTAPDATLCTFAIRIPAAERDALHETAGPGGASRFARAVLNAAAGRDVEAFKAALKTVEA